MSAQTQGQTARVREPKILLYYCFTPLTDPDAIRLWQHTLCESLGLRGRILVSRHGINGTVGGPLTSIKAYIRETRSYPAFHDIDFKWSEGTGADFPRLRVRVRDEIVTFGRPDELVVSSDGVVGGGTHLKPEDVNRLVEQRGDDVVFFDGRNAFEARIGRFKGAVVPDVGRTPEFIAALDSGEYDHLKDKAVITYCTGGVRCEILSALMKNRGFKEVYQVEGGIVRYTDRYGDSSLWEGSLYVFDERLKIDFSRDPDVLGTCDKCTTPTASFHNCAVSTCRKRILVCDDCVTAGVDLTCPDC